MAPRTGSCSSWRWDAGQCCRGGRTHRLRRPGCSSLPQNVESAPPVAGLSLPSPSRSSAIHRVVAGMGTDQMAHLTLSGGRPGLLACLDLLRSASRWARHWPLPPTPGKPGLRRSARCAWPGRSAWCRSSPTWRPLACGGMAGVGPEAGAAPGMPGRSARGPDVRQALRRYLAEGSRAGMPPSRDRMPSRWIVRTSVTGP